MNIYRKIWTENFGPIPNDESGRSYEIHHIDGNRSNNDINNLRCVSLQEHYNIHYNQGDYSACILIGLKLKLSKDQISEIRSKVQLKKIEEGNHSFLDSKFQSKYAKQRVQQGTHHFLSENFSFNVNKIRIKNGTHNFLKENVKIVECPYCEKTGDIGNMKRWHFENCKNK